VFVQRRKTASELIKYFDHDGDGSIDLQEFRDGMNELMKVLVVDRKPLVLVCEIVSITIIVPQVEAKFILRKIDLLFAEISGDNSPTGHSRNGAHFSEEAQKKQNKAAKKSAEDPRVAPMTASGYALQTYILCVKLNCGFDIVICCND